MLQQLKLFSILVKVSITVKRHYDHGNSYKGKHLLGFSTVSEIYFIIFMIGHGDMQADMVLVKELRVLYLTGNRM